MLHAPSAFWASASPVFRVSIYNTGEDVRVGCLQLRYREIVCYEVELALPVGGFEVDIEGQDVVGVETGGVLILTLLDGGWIPPLIPPIILSWESHIHGAPS